MNVVMKREFGSPEAIRYRITARLRGENRLAEAPAP
jgi:hypothetical protein